MHRIPRYLVIEFWLTLVAVAACAIFIILGENAQGWAGIGYVLYALAVAALWIVVSAFYMIWIIIREGGGRTARPAMAVLAVVLALGVAFVVWWES